MSLASYFCGNHQPGHIISYVKFSSSFSQPMLHIILHLSTLTFIHCFIALSLLLQFLKFASSCLEKSSIAEKENSIVGMKRGRRATLLLCQPAHALWLYRAHSFPAHGDNSDGEQAEGQTRGQSWKSLICSHVRPVRGTHMPCQPGAAQAALRHWQWQRCA